MTEDKFKFIVYCTVQQVQPNANMFLVLNAIQASMKKKISLTSVFLFLDKLEREGYLSSKVVDYRNYYTTDKILEEPVNNNTELRMSYTAL